MKRIFSAAFLALIGCGGEPQEIEFGLPDAWNQPPLLPAPHGPRLAFTNSGDDSISFLDLATLSPIAKVQVGIFPIEREGPHHLVASPDGRHLFVGISNVVPLNARGPHGSHGTGTADGYLLKIDAITGREIDRARVSKSPGDVRFDPSGTKIWQSHFNLAQVIQVVMNGGSPRDFDSFLIATDTETMQRADEVRICSAGHGLGFSPDGASMYAACWMSDQLAVVTLNGLSVERVILGPEPGGPPAPRYQPYALTVSPADARVWISAQGPGRTGLYVYDATARAMVDNAVVRTEGLPVFGTFSPDGARLYMVTQRPDRLLEIDPAASMIVRDIDVTPFGCQNAHSVALANDDQFLWMVCEGDQKTTPGTFHRLRRDTLAAMERVELGLFPDDVALVPMPETQP